MTLAEVLDGLREMELDSIIIQKATIEVRTPHCGSFQITNVAWQNGKVVLWCE